VLISVGRSSGLRLQLRVRPKSVQCIIGQWIGRGVMPRAALTGRSSGAFCDGKIAARNGWAE
jgi:hypothetical protein